VLDGLLVVLTLAMMALYSLKLTAVALAAVALYGAAALGLLRPLREATEEALVFEARQNSHFLESLRGVQAIKLFNAQADRAVALCQPGGGHDERRDRHAQAGAAVRVLHRLLFGLERVAVIWLGALLVLDRSLSLGMLFAFFAYKEQFALRVSGLIDKAVELRMLRLQGERLADIVLTAPEADGRAAPRARAPATAGDRAAHVSFRYADGEPEVLRGVNLRIEPGESVAIVGPVGLRQDDAAEAHAGRARADVGRGAGRRRAAGAAGPAAWRDMVGVVMQDEPLFSGSIADNIAFFDPPPDLAGVEQCARVAAVHDDIEAMPMGYHTLIGDMGTALSGGQKQRMLLARALYKRPRAAARRGDQLARRRARAHGEPGGAAAGADAHHRGAPPETIASAGRVVALHEGRVAQDLRSVAASAPTQVDAGGRRSAA
jgi:ATP-binding cassette, subfamily B, bacterial CvaB/MchF/RaxB